ncbi:hypothetical protein WS67_09115 [Burkholderia singularis]|uniref:Uncharacterized protein n=1 Tax=Burkholderia singularis TaxID=1503053 RepID=A0A103E6A9_9BURK|nr:hypothetical protein WS67_09115 [Burkholderia singularis]
MALSLNRHQLAGPVLKAPYPIGPASPDGGRADATMAAPAASATTVGPPAWRLIMRAGGNRKQ